MYTWNWGILLQHSSVFIEGALVTLGLTLLAVVGGTGLGFILALLTRSDEPLLRWPSWAYIQLFRALPILVVIIWIFYVGPILVGLRLSPFLAGVVALSLHLAAFAAETIRSGIESVPRRQVESGLVLGLSRWQTLRQIVLPQALRTMMPNLLGLYITELKNSSLLSIIAVDELLHKANVLISNTFRPLEVYTAVAVVYLMLILPLIYLASRLEGRLKAHVRTA